MALKIHLSPGRKVFINGAVISNLQEHAFTLTVDRRAAILRDRDVMLPEQADTPAKQVYLWAQMMYIEPEHLEEYRSNFTDAAKLAYLNLDDAGRSRIFAAVGFVAADEFFKALKVLKETIGPIGNENAVDSQGDKAGARPKAARNKRQD